MAAWWRSMAWPLGVAGMTELFWQPGRPGSFIILPSLLRLRSLGFANISWGLSPAPHCAWIGCKCAGRLRRSIPKGQASLPPRRPTPWPPASSPARAQQSLAIIRAMAGSLEHGDRAGSTKSLPRPRRRPFGFPVPPCRPEPAPPAACSVLSVRPALCPGSPAQCGRKLSVGRRGECTTVHARHDVRHACGSACSAMHATLRHACLRNPASSAVSCAHVLMQLWLLGCRIPPACVGARKLAADGSCSPPHVCCGAAGVAGGDEPPAHAPSRQLHWFSAPSAP